MLSAGLKLAMWVVNRYAAVVMLMGESTKVKASLGVVGAVTVLALVLGALLISSCQRSLIFPGTEIVPPYPSAPPEVEALWFEVGEARVEAWLLPAQRSSAVAGPALVFAHGNYEVIDHHVRAFEPLQRAGVSVLLVEYPGYGRSSGSPTQESIERVMLSAYDALVARPEVAPDQVVAWGRSLGGGAACLLASSRPLRGLILESTFSSMTAMARQFWIPAFMVKDPLNNLGVVARFERPVLIFHGRADEVIPHAHAQQLAGAAPQGRLVTLECGHNDCGKDWDAILGFFREVGALDAP